MEVNRPVRCPENEEITLYLLRKRKEMADPNGISENLDKTLSNAYRNICSSKTPINSLKDLSKIKGVGKWLLRIMKGFFPESPTNLEDSPNKNVAQKGKQLKGPKRYVPQKNSVAYALLVTLYREMANGRSFMKKQELIDAAEASGLSRTAIGPDKSKGKPGQFGSSSRDWYTGWNCMKTLVLKGLVVKSSCPAKYMLTEEGQAAAQECMLRSGLSDSSVKLTSMDGSSCSHSEQRKSDLHSAGREATTSSTSLICQKEVNDDPIRNFGGDTVDSSDSDSAEVILEDCPATATLSICSSLDTGSTNFVSGSAQFESTISNNLVPRPFDMRACTSLGHAVEKPLDGDGELDTRVLAMPPRRGGGNFEETYDVILVLDDRENFGSRSKKVVDNISSQFKVLVEVRRLPVGDGIWIVRRKQTNIEYVLDFIVERKKVDDLCSSIRDNRYRDQKLRLQRCGLRKLIYLVEGDPNSLEAAESIKTACFTTEILEGFDVQRTSGFADTVRKYGHLTKSITQYYSTYFGKDNSGTSLVCPTFSDFIKKCQDLEKMTVTDVFALQLMQVPQVTEEIAVSVIDMYPTLLSLAHAYARLEGDVRAQEDLLRNQCKTVGGGASKNIYKLVWGC